MDYFQSLCCGGCVAPYSVVIVPSRGLSDPVLLPDPRGRREEGRLPKCKLWALPGLSLLCVTPSFGYWVGWVREAAWLLPLPSVWVSLLLLSFPPLRARVEKVQALEACSFDLNSATCVPEYLSNPH